MFLAAALSASGAPAPLSNPVSASTNAAVDRAYQKLQADDDAAQAEVDKWTRENNALKATGGGVAEAELDQRIRQRLAPVTTEYKDFLRQHPNHAQAHLTYGCFLNDHGDELGAQAEWEKALALDPGNADIYNNLAGRYSESGPVSKAFEYYAKAIELKSNQPLYYQNFANSLYVLRKRGMAYYGLNEQQVFAKIIGLYSNSVRLDPKNFASGCDFAQTYYSMKPFPATAALNAWSNTLHSAEDQSQREFVYLHLARVQMLDGRLAEARALAEAVTSGERLVARSNLLHNIELRQTQGP